MKKLSTILCIAVFTIAALSTRAQEDTIGFWKIQYNDKEIAPVTLNGEQTYYLTLLTDTDKVNVFYYTESPCKECLCKLELRNEDGAVIKTMQRKGYGDNKPFYLQGKELEDMFAKGRVYMYFTGKYDGWMPWILMGSLRRP